MTLNGEMALILREFLRKLVILGAYGVKVVDSHNYGPFMITMSSSKRLQRDRATPTA